MRPTEEQDHLLSAYRQLGADGRHELVRQIMAAAGARRSGGDLERLCERWLETPDDAFFAHIVVAYGKLDPIHELAGGRAPGAVSAKTKYLRGLAARHPGKTAKELYRVAVGEARDGVFYEVGRELIDAKTDKPVTVEAFGKSLSKATSPPKSKAKNLRKR